MRLKDKVAIVTGANSGIGQAIARRFAEEGAHVAVNYLPGGTRDQDAAAVVKGLAAEGLAVPADVSQRDQVQRMVDATVARFGRLDIAVNNAGIEIKRPFLEVTDQEWNAVIGVNLYGAFLLCQIAARQMVKQGGGGKIVNISSCHEDIPFPNFMPYCCSKGGMRMLCRNLCIELAPHQINVNNIAPGAIETPINRPVLEDPTIKAKVIAEVPWGRFGEPDEVASVAVFLASSESNYVTGSTYYVDGGLTQQVTQY